MTRRQLAALFASATLPASSAEPPQRSLYELRFIRLRNGPENQRQRTTAFLKTYVALAKSAGAGPIGLFSSSVGEGAPYLVVLTSFRDYAGMGAARQKLAADPDYAKARAELEKGGPPFERQEVNLLLAFPGYPAITPPPTEGRKTSRLFELRMYELENFTHLERKIRMFDEGETAIFIRAGMLPVFFGETLAGSNLPSLWYMLGFDDLAARESTGRVSGADPAWKTLGAQYPDVATVPKLSISFLTPLAFSDIR